MKDQETKLRYIELRASGKSYRSIAEELGISKSTCGAWEKELADAIEDTKQDHERELIESYQLSRASRIDRLKSTLDQINEELSKRGLDDVSTEKLLKYKLDYERFLRDETLEPVEAPEQSIEGVLKAYSDLYRDSLAGRITPAQTKSQITILESTLKALNQKEASEMWEL